MKSLSDFMKKDNEQEPMKDEHYDAKMAILEQLRELAHELMNDKYGDKMKGMREVSVQAPNKEGLTKGLNMAQQLVGDHEEGPPEEEASESPEEESSEDEMDAEDMADHGADESEEDQKGARKRY